MQVKFRPLLVKRGILTALIALGGCHTASEPSTTPEDILPLVVCGRSTMTSARLGHPVAIARRAPIPNDAVVITEPTAFVDVLVSPHLMLRILESSEVRLSVAHSIMTYAIPQVTVTRGRVRCVAWAAQGNVSLTIDSARFHLAASGPIECEVSALGEVRVLEGRAVLVEHSLTQDQMPVIGSGDIYSFAEHTIRPMRVEERAALQTHCAPLRTLAGARHK